MDISLHYTVCKTEETSAGVSVTLEKADKSDMICLLVSHDFCRKLHLKTGDTISEEEYEEIRREADLNKAISRTVKILSYSDHSKAQLVKKLVAYGFSRDTAVNAAACAEERGYINENDQAARTASYYAKTKYWGKKRIAAELFMRGYERAAVLAALDGITEEEYIRSLKRVISRKFSPIPTEYEERAKMIASLCRLGYSAREIDIAAAELEAEQA